jgi:hypothetical protein
VSYGGSTERRRGGVLREGFGFYTGSSLIGNCQARLGYDHRRKSSEGFPMQCMFLFSQSSNAERWTIPVANRVLHATHHLSMNAVRGGTWLRVLTRKTFCTPTVGGRRYLVYALVGIFEGSSAQYSSTYVPGLETQEVELWGFYSVLCSNWNCPPHMHQPQAVRRFTRRRLRRNCSIALHSSRIDGT